MRRIIREGQRWVWGASPEPAGSRPAGWVSLRPTRAAVVPDELDPGLRVTPGSEMVGVVLEDTAETTDPRRWKGKRVVASPLVVCGRCDLCRAGLSTHCRESRLMGRDVDGVLSERVSVPATNLVELPRALDDDRAALSAPLARVLHAASLARLEGKVYVSIVGDGVEALLASQVMTQRNASVRVLGRDEKRYGLCEKWGAKHRHLDEVGRRADQDLVFVATPGELETALRLVRPRGTVIILHQHAATPNDRASQAAAAPLLSLIVERELIVLGSRALLLAEAVELLAKGGIDAQSLLTSRRRVADFEQALTEASGAGALRTLVEF